MTFSPLKSRAVKRIVPCSAEEKRFRKRMTKYMDGIGPSLASSRKEETKP
jgi:ArsR family metal-binding transcriptional regulator